MSAQAAETPQTPGETPPLTKSGEPDKRFTAGGAGKRSRKRKRARSTTTTTSTPRARPTIHYGDLHDQLKNGAMGMATGVLMFTSDPAMAGSPAVMDALETRADKFADAWVAVARQDPRVAKYLAQLLSGGVWVAAAGNSIAFVLLVGIFSGRVRTIPMPATFFMPELQPFLRYTPPPTPGDTNATPAEHAERDGTGDHLGSVPPGDDAA